MTGGAGHRRPPNRELLTKTLRVGDASRSSRRRSKARRASRPRARRRTPAEPGRRGVVRRGADRGAADAGAAAEDAGLRRRRRCCRRCRRCRDRCAGASVTTVGGRRCRRGRGAPLPSGPRLRRGGARRRAVQPRSCASTHSAASRQAAAPASASTRADRADRAAAGAARRLRRRRRSPKRRCRRRVDAAAGRRRRPRSAAVVQRLPPIGARRRRPTGREADACRDSRRAGRADVPLNPAPLTERDARADRASSSGTSSCFVVRSVALVQTVGGRERRDARGAASTPATSSRRPRRKARPAAAGGRDRAGLGRRTREPDSPATSSCAATAPGGTLRPLTPRADPGDDLPRHRRAVGRARTSTPSSRSTRPATRARSRPASREPRGDEWPATAVAQRCRQLHVCK